jgi:GNAT superfamily N-acetyltransferase
MPVRAPIRLRRHKPGDMGWVVHRHGELYAREWGYTAQFEALVARIVADFLDDYDASSERCWIAERDGRIVGSVFVVRKSKDVAKLRLLLVEPSARGSGLGKRLVDECIRFARRAGYRKIALWTQAELTAARRLYEAAGFACVKRVKQTGFGSKGLAETWELEL